MNILSSHFSKKQRVTAVIAVTIGNFLEWYEIFLFVYWAPIISKLFFKPTTEYSGLIYTFFLFALGFLARPLGGIFFGRLGDLVGRRKSLLLSVLVMIVPTFITGFLPTYAQIGIFAPVILAFMRIFQAFPAGGELPGAACYLYESAPWQSRRYLCSWTSWGYQLGILASTLECYLLERFLSPEDLITWGWRASFLAGGLIGLLGLCLRYQLHETPLYKEMETHEKVVKEPILQVLQKHRKPMVKGFLYCALNSSAFYFLTVNFPIYLGNILNTQYRINLVISMFMIILITVPLPLFGKLGDCVNNKKMLMGSTIGIFLSLYPLYLAINSHSTVWMVVMMIIFGLLVTSLSALIPYILVDLFPTRDRFTCSALSFNLADAIIGGFTPMVTFFLLQHTQNQGSVVWILLFGAILSFSGYLFVKDHHTIK